MPQTKTITVDVDGQTIGIPVDASTPDAMLPRLLEGHIRSIQRQHTVLNEQAKNFPTNAEQGGPAGSVTPPLSIGAETMAKIKSFAGKAANAVSPFLPTMKDVPAMAGSAIGTAIEPGAGSVLGAMGGEGIRQIFNQLRTGTPQPPGEAASNYLQAAGAPMTEGLGGALLGKLGLQKGVQAAAGGPLRWIEQRLLGTGQAAEKRALTARLAPEMAQDPAFSRAFSQKQFDTQIVNRMTTAKTLLDRAESAVPPETMAQKGPLLAKIDALMNDFRIPGETLTTTEHVATTQPQAHMPTRLQTSATPQSVSVNKDALAALKELHDEVNKFPEDIPWKDLQDFRQKLDKNIFLKGGFKETATAADRAKIIAEREVANATRGHLADSLPGGLIKDNMRAANAAYSKAADMGLASGMDFELGRRLSDVGSRTAMQKIAPWIIPAVATEEIGRRAINRFGP